MAREIVIRLKDRHVLAKFTEIPADHAAKEAVQGVYTAAVRAESPAWGIGLRKGDIIVAVNQKQVTSLTEFEQAAKAAGRVLALSILRGDTQLFVVVQ
jgi:S1-C subfamily serine protease